jgi:isoleucyl-tRNA synthetase
MGTALNKISKDIIMRVKRLQGFDVFDRAGYDTHGVPIEFQIEKEIGSKSRKDIEKYGVKKFIDRCKKFATRFIGVMNKEFENLGVWMDFENPYLTLKNEYIEAIWDTFKKADEKKLLYLGKYPVHVCPRCETAVAYNEIEYGIQEDTSIYVKFPLRKEKNKFLIIWTTTPWTLPGNTAVMVNPNVDYQEVELSSGEKWIIAKELVSKIMSELEGGYTIKDEFKGKKMEGWEYENPLSKNLKLKTKNAYKVILSGRYVNTEEGTGLVHCAPGHGKEDYEVGREYKIDMPSPVEINGLMSEEAGKYSGKKARVVDEEIIEDLNREGFLVHKVKYSHDYPMCWRCKSPLLMISLPQWFFRIQNIQKKLLKSNSEVGWVPSYMELRMKAWLEGISDWPISRNRYWGTPLPIWTCDKCENKIVIGSIKELEKMSGKKIKEVHKPEIDEVKWKCKCGGLMKRVPEVLDVWFDSGVSSWAALNYPQKENLFRKFWPADINIEGKDQVRGWWNSQIILSEIRFGKKPFKNISVHGMVLDLGKRKMSKSKGNIISPQNIIEKYGRDYLRYYFAKISKGEDFSFDEEEFREIQKVFTILLNVNNFIKQAEEGKQKIKIEDEWIISRLNSVIKEVTESYNEFKYYEGLQKLEKFLVDDLSRTYIKIIRDRTEETKKITEKIFIDVLKLFSSLIPFVTEKIWQELEKNHTVSEQSIFLSSFPKSDAKKINKKLEEEFESVMKIIEAGLAERDKVKIGLKWPLAKAVIQTNKQAGKNLIEIIERQLNVKKIDIKKGNKISVKFDTKMTPELEAEGYAREISRQVQAFRKKLGLEKRDKIRLLIFTDGKMKKFFEKNANYIKERTNSKKIEFFDESVTTNKERFKNETGFMINNKRGKIAIITTD